MVEENKIRTEELTKFYLDQLKEQNKNQKLNQGKMGRKKSLIIVNMPSAAGEILIDQNESISNVTNGSEDIKLV